MNVDACCTLGIDRDGGPNRDALLRELDRADVDKAVCHPADHGYAWDNEAGNRVTLAAQSRHPDRLLAAVTANPWRPDAVQVIEQGLEQGGRLLSFAPAVQGFNLSSRLLDPILRACCGKGKTVPVYLHTGHHSHGTPAQLLLLARRFPTIRFLMGHAGATDYGTDAVPVARQCPNVLLESSSARPPGFVAKCGHLDPDRGIMGSGFPDNDLVFEWSEMRRLLPDTLRDRVCGDNLMTILGTRS